MIFILIKIKFDDDINNDELLKGEKHVMSMYVLIRASPTVLST